MGASSALGELVRPCMPPSDAEKVLFVPIELTKRLIETNTAMIGTTINLLFIM
jgi:hypothetical protein